MRNAFLIAIVLAASVAALPHAQQLPPTDVPARLLKVQQLALSAYPELRTIPVQVRVSESDSGLVVTFGHADRDRDEILALSRPREALLVCETSFDATQGIRAATLRGMLTRIVERRRVRALTGDLGKALDDDGAAFGPNRQAAFLNQLDLSALRRVLGALTVNGTQFQTGATEDDLYWDVAATSLTGETVNLGFEPYAGRLVRLTRGGVQ